MLRPQIQSHATNGVYQTNLKLAFDQIKLALMTHRFISIDTEFRGAQIFQEPKYLDPQEKYSNIKQNVDAGKMMQLGITLMNEKGELATPVCCWQFNFRFNIRNDVSSPRSLELLRQAGRFNYDVLPAVGVDLEDFRRLAIEANLFHDQRNTFIAFHGQFDVFFVLKAIVGSLPDSREESRSLISSVFGKIIDLKYLIMHNEQFTRYGLQGLADELGIPRFGVPHTAGSDSFLTGRTFFAARDIYLLFGNEQIEAYESKIAGFDVFSVTNGRYCYY